MRVFMAGASGVIGIRLVPLLIADGHVVAGLTRSPAKASHLRELGAEPVVCDAFDGEGLTAAVAAFGPDLVIHELTDLPDRAADIAAFGHRNARIRTEGTSPDPPRVHVDDAAKQTMLALSAPAGLTIVVDDRSTGPESAG